MNLSFEQFQGFATYRRLLTEAGGTLPGQSVIGFFEYACVFTECHFVNQTPQDTFENLRECMKLFHMIQQAYVRTNHDQLLNLFQDGFLFLGTEWDIPCWEMFAAQFPRIARAFPEAHLRQTDEWYLVFDAVKYDMAQPVMVTWRDGQESKRIQDFNGYDWELNQEYEITVRIPVETMERPRVVDEWGCFQWDASYDGEFFFPEAYGSVELEQGPDFQQYAISFRIHELAVHNYTVAHRTNMLEGEFPLPVAVEPLAVMQASLVRHIHKSITTLLDDPGTYGAYTHTAFFEYASNLVNGDYRRVSCVKRAGT